MGAVSSSFKTDSGYYKIEIFTGKDGETKLHPEEHYRITKGNRKLHDVTIFELQDKEYIYIPKNELNDQIINLFYRADKYEKLYPDLQANYLYGFALISALEDKSKIYLKDASRIQNLKYTDDPAWCLDMDPCFGYEKHCCSFKRKKSLSSVKKKSVSPIPLMIIAIFFIIIVIGMFVYFN